MSDEAIPHAVQVTLLQMASDMARMENTELSDIFHRYGLEITVSEAPVA